MGREEHRRIRLAGFKELCKSGVDGIRMVRRIGILGPKVFLVEAADKGNNISNQADAIKPGFWGEGETFEEDSDL